jgi:hypothetical protein
MKRTHDQMRIRSKLILAGLAATVFMAYAVGTASATRLESSSQNFRIQWNPLIFAAGGGVSVSCPVTLAGSFHSRTISKVSGQLIGFVNVAQVGAPETCMGGQARARTESLPWHVQYNSFSGTLPRITGVTLTLVGARFEILAAGNRCEAGTTQTNPAWGRANVNEATGRVESFTALGEHTIPLGGGFTCSFVSPGRFLGTGSVDDGAGNALTVRLVR